MRRYSGPGNTPPAEAELPNVASGAAGDADAMLDAWIEGNNANMPPHLDPDALADLYAENCTNIQPLRELPGGPLHGREAMRRFFAAFDAHWSDLRMVEVSRVAQGRRAVWEAIMNASHKKSGKLVKLPIVFILDFDKNGKVKEQHVYVDNGLVEEQIR